MRSTLKPRYGFMGRGPVCDRMYRAWSRYARLCFALSQCCAEECDGNEGVHRHAAGNLDNAFH